MKKRAKRLLSLILSVALLCTCLLVGVSLPASAATVLFEENFDSYQNGTLPSNWKIASQSGVTDISVQDGALQLKAAGSSDAPTGVVYMGDELKNVGDYTFEADYTVTGSDYPLSVSTRYSSMLYRVSGDTLVNGHYAPYYYCTMRVRKSVNNEISARTSGTGYFQMATKPYTEDMVMNQTYHLKVVCSGASVKYYIDNNLQFNITLSKSSSSYPYLTAGTIGFNTSNLTVKFDNVKVTEAAAPADAQPSLYDTYVPTTDLAVAPSVIADVTSATELDEVKGEKLPATTLYYLDKDLNVTDPTGKTVITTLSQALKKTAGKVIPALYVRDAATVTALKSFADEVSLQDAFLVADNTALLKTARTQMTNLYGVLYTKLSAAATKEDLAAMVANTNAGSGKIVMVDADYVTKADVEYMQKRLMNVWVIGSMDTDGIYTNIVKGVNGIITEDYASVIAALESFNTGTAGLTRTPFLIGHRGYLTKYPQNTLASFRGAVAAGATIIETDVHQTKDGIVMIYHDDYLYTLTSCTDKTKTIENSTYAEVRQYTVKYEDGSPSSEVIPTFEEFLNEFKGTDVVYDVEIKNLYDTTLVQKTVDLMKKTGTESQVISISFGGDQILKMRSQAPGTSMGFLVNYTSSYTTTDAILNWTRNWTTTYGSTFHPNTGVVYSGSTLRTELLDKAGQRGITYYPWTYIDRAKFDSSYIGGIQGITTNYMEFGNTYVNYLEADSTYTMKADVPQTIKATGVKDVGSTPVACEIKVISGDDITFTNSAGKITADKAGTVKALLMYKQTTTAGSYYAYSSQPVTIQVEKGTGPVPVMNKITSLMPASADVWVNAVKNMNVDVTRGTNNSFVFTNTTGNWPAAVADIDAVQASVYDKLQYEVTVGKKMSLLLILNGGQQTVMVQKAFEGNNTFDGDDIIGNGATFTGTLDLYNLIPTEAADLDGNFTITGVKVFDVGNAGAVVELKKLNLVHQVALVDERLGDADGDKALTSADARLILLQSVEETKLDEMHMVLADYNQDGKVNSTDAREVLVTLVNQ